MAEVQFQYVKGIPSSTRGQSPFYRELIAAIAAAPPGTAVRLLPPERKEEHFRFTKCVRVNLNQFAKRNEAEWQYHVSYRGDSLLIWRTPRNGAKP